MDPTLLRPRILRQQQQQPAQDDWLASHATHAPAHATHRAALGTLDRAPQPAGRPPTPMPRPAQPSQPSRRTAARRPATRASRHAPPSSPPRMTVTPGSSTCTTPQPPPQRTVVQDTPSAPPRPLHAGPATAARRLPPGLPTTVIRARVPAAVPPAPPSVALSEQDYGAHSSSGEEDTQAQRLRQRHTETAAPEASTEDGSGVSGWSWLRQDGSGSERSEFGPRDGAVDHYGLPLGDPATQARHRLEAENFASLVGQLRNHHYSKLPPEVARQIEAIINGSGTYAQRTEAITRALSPERPNRSARVEEAEARFREALAKRQHALPWQAPHRAQPRPGRGFWAQDPYRGPDVDVQQQDAVPSQRSRPTTARYGDIWAQEPDAQQPAHGARVRLGRGVLRDVFGPEDDGGSEASWGPQDHERQTEFRHAPSWMEQPHSQRFAGRHTQPESPSSTPPSAPSLAVPPQLRRGHRSSLVQGAPLQLDDDGRLDTDTASIRSTGTQGTEASGSNAGSQSNRSGPTSPQPPVRELKDEALDNAAKQQLIGMGFDKDRVVVLSAKYSKDKAHVKIESGNRSKCAGLLKIAGVVALLATIASVVGLFILMCSSSFRGWHSRNLKGISTKNPDKTVPASALG